MLSKYCAVVDGVFNMRHCKPHHFVLQAVSQRVHALLECLSICLCLDLDNMSVSHVVIIANEH